jgi:hypothetical protein
MVTVAYLSVVWPHVSATIFISSRALLLANSPAGQAGQSGLSKQTGGFFSVIKTKRQFLLELQAL